MGGGGTMGRNFDVSQYQAATRKRTGVSALLIFLAIPFSMVALGRLLGSNMYLIGSFLIVVYTLIPFIMVFENRKPKAREVVLIAMMSALTVVIHMFFHLTLPLQAGTAMVIISGISLGPEAGFLVGALSRLVCNFYMGQGPWTPWQMFCWGLLGFLAGLTFNKIDYEEVRKKGFKEELGSRSFKFIMRPVMCIIFAVIVAYTAYILFPGEDKTFFGWRLYAFGIAGLISGALVQRKKLTVDGITMALFTFFVTFIIYGGIMNICAMFMSAGVYGGKPISLNALRLLYITGVPYDAQHAGSAAVFIFLFGNIFIKKVERIKIKYGIYR